MVGFDELECLADLYTDVCAARNSQNADVMTQGTQTFGEKRNLGGFSAAFRSFESDEEAFGHFLRAFLTSALWAYLQWPSLWFSIRRGWRRRV